MLDTRQNVRPHAVEMTTGVLYAGLERLPVKLKEESITGWSVISQRRPELDIDAEVQLRLCDGRTLDGVINQIDEIADGFLIGLRSKVTQAESTDEADLRDAFPAVTKRSSSQIYLWAILIGLVIGLLAQSNLRSYLVQAVSKIAGLFQD